MTGVGYLNNTLLRVLSIKKTDDKEAVVGQGGQVLCELGKLSKSLRREGCHPAREHWQRPALECGARREEVKD